MFGSFEREREREREVEGKIIERNGYPPPCLDVFKIK